jgi:nitroreductase
VDVEEAIRTTRAIRRYTDEPVSDDDLSAILFAASRAPSGSNRQPFRFVVLRDGPVARDAKALLGDAFRRAWGAKARHDGYDEGSGAEASSPKARMARTMQRFVDRFEDTPVVILPCLRRYRDPHPTEGASVYPACQNLLLAARARGLGGVITMWHEPVEDELRRLVGIPDGVVVTGCIALGHPEGSHGPVRRRPLAELVYDDRWGDPAPWAQDPPGTRFTGAGPPRK